MFYFFIKLGKAFESIVWSLVLIFNITNVKQVNLKIENIKIVELKKELWLPRFNINFEVKVVIFESKLGFCKGGHIRK